MNSGKQIVTPFLALIMVFGFFGVLMFIGTHGVPDNETTKNVVLILVGALASQFANVLGYYFGTSKGSSDKSAVLSATLEKAINKPAGEV